MEACPAGADGRYVYLYAFSLFDATIPMCGCCLCRNEKKSNPSFFPAFARESNGGVDPSFAKMMISLFTHCSGGSSFLVGVFQNALLRERERERERDKQMCFPISPKTREKEREDQHLISPNKKKCKREGKKNESTAKTYQRKRKRERERECFFLGKRDIFPPFSLSFL